MVVNTDLTSRWKATVNTTSYISGTATQFLKIHSSQSPLVPTAIFLEVLLLPVSCLFSSLLLAAI